MSVKSFDSLFGKHHFDGMRSVEWDFYAKADFWIERTDDCEKVLKY